MSALATDNLPLLAGAPNGVKKLRELILELAVRGKLVPQDPNDEPASELLKRIAEEKARLISEEGLRTTARADVPEAEHYFKLQVGWASCRLGNLARFIDYRGRTPTKTSSGVPLITAKNVRSGFINREPREFIAKTDYLTWMTRGFPRIGDILFTTEAPMGNVAIIDIADRFALAQRVICLQLHELETGPFLKLIMMSSGFQAQLSDAATGMTATGIKSSRLKEIPAPIPPLAEQHRIVAKVDELMALCDRLETQKADAQRAHAQLVQALLDSLTQASDSADFAASWQRLAEHFHTLFTTESSIDALKQTLLQLAVMGKLVPQDPNGEPASVQLRRVDRDKAQLVVKGKIRKQKELADVTEHEKPFELPTGWEWCRLGVLVIESSAGWSPSCEQSPREGSEWGVLKVSAVSWGVYRPEENKALPASLEARPEHEVAVGDFLVSRANTAELVARSVVVDETPNNLMLSDKIVRLKLATSCDRHYVNLANSTPCAREYYARVAGGTSSSMKNVSREQILSLPISLPPLAEQHRIVAKVDQLMALCDQLKARLSQARELNEQLASTLVEQAVTDDSSRVSVIADQKTARTLLAAEITDRLHDRRTFGQRKLQKVVYLAEHAARLAEIQGSYLRNVAGPHDRQLMSEVEAELKNRQWYECIERETVGRAYRPLAEAGQHRQAYSALWSATERATIEKVINLMRDWDTDRCEMTVTLYAVWNDLILEGRSVTDAAIVDEVLHSWNDSKLRFAKDEWLAVLDEMKKSEILIPTGFGKRTTGGMLSLPGFE